MDPDLWGHVRFGLDLLGTRRIVRPDPYSYVSGDQPWINHEWLAEAVLALVFQLAGPTGLIVLKVAIGALIGLVLARHLGRLGVGEGIVLAGTFGLLWPWLGAVRPQMFTFLCLSLLLVLIDRAERGQASGAARPSDARDSSCWGWPRSRQSWRTLTASGSPCSSCGRPPSRGPTSPSGFPSRS
jgi:hypothetical protein